MNPRFILVIPVAWELERLGPFLRDLAETMDALAKKCAPELWIVDDGSAQEDFMQLTVLVDGVQESFPGKIQLLRLETNLGKGGAILAGWRAAGAADYYAFCDADGSVSATEILRMTTATLACQTPQAFFAVRVHMPGRRVQRGLLRHLMGRLFSGLVRIFIAPAVRDSQCGFKIIPGTFLTPVLPLLEGHRFAFDVELLAALLQNRRPVVEFPVDWVDVPGSRVRLLRDSLRMLYSLGRIRRKLRQRSYQA